MIRLNAAAGRDIHNIVFDCEASRGDVDAMDVLPTVAVCRGADVIKYVVFDRHICAATFTRCDATTASSVSATSRTLRYGVDVVVKHAFMLARRLNPDAGWPGDCETNNIHVLAGRLQRGRAI